LGKARTLKVRYTPRAARQLDAILDYIDARSPQGAAHVFDRIEATLAMLADHPNSGQALPQSSMRRIVATPYPYLIFYSVTAEGVTIHRIRHAARR